jgi:hypothetical protein
MSHLEPTIKTYQEIAAEHVKALAEQGDLTSAAMRYQQKMEEVEGVSQPVGPGRRGMPPRRPYRR